MFRRLFTRYKAVKTFTYYIPAPPTRPSGYREKALDKIVYELGQAGHEIIDIKTEQMSGNNSTGIVVILLLGALTEQAAQLNLDFSDQFGLSKVPTDGDIELG